MLGEKIFINPPFGRDNQITTKEGGKFSKDSGTLPNSPIIETDNLPLLGDGLHHSPKGLSKIENQRLSKDAAALCQYIYCDDELRPNGDVSYSTATHSHNMMEGWVSYRYLQKKNDLKDFFHRCTNLQDLYEKLNGYFPNSESYLERQRTGFNSDIYFLIKKEDFGLKGCCYVLLVAYVIAGSRPLLNIQSKNGNRFGGMLDWFGDWFLSDFIQGLSGLSPQHTLAIQNSKKILKVCDECGLDLIFIGHSLGGGVAASCAISNQRPAIVFNMAGLHFTRILKNKKNYDILLKEHKILSYYLEGELLSAFPWTLIGLKHNGNRYKIAYDKSKNSIADQVLGNDTHGIVNICRLFGLRKIARTETKELIENIYGTM